MKLLPSESQRGPSGAAEVKLNKNDVAIRFIETGQTFTFNKVDLPESAKKISSGTFFVGLSAQGDKIFGIRPFNATVLAKFSHFAAKENQLPAPKHVTGSRNRKDGTSYPVDELTFSAIGVITNGPYEGMEIVFPFVYARKGAGFVDDGNGNLSVRGGGKKIEQMVAFLEVAGAWDKVYPFSDNVLPALEKALKAEEREFMVVMRNGWPESFGEVPNISRKVVKKDTKKKKG